jgi:tRNA pseudouridine38-40 synthase
VACLKLYLSYDGTGWRGWQRQLNTEHTLQAAIEGRLATIMGEKVHVTASGRTDSGVHARVQVAHVRIPDKRLALLELAGPLREPKLKQALNSMLPHSVRVLRVEQAPDDFHAIRDAVKKTYLYFIDTAPVQLPELRHHTWHLRLPLDWKAMEEAAKAFKGKHDYKAFCGKGAVVKTTVRTVHEARWGTIQWNGICGPRELRVFRVTGSGFLKHMVRSMVGTLVHVGEGKSPVDVVERALKSAERSMAGPTAPAHGLWLWDVLYR